MLILEGHQAQVLSVAYAPDSRTLASGDAAGSLRLWDLGTGRGRAAIPDAGGPVVSLAFAPGGNTLAVGTYNRVTFWDMAGRQPGSAYRGALPGTQLVAFAPDGQVAVVAGYLDPHLTVWEWATSELVDRLRGHRCGVLALAHAPHHPLLVSGGGMTNAGELHVWDTTSCVLRQVLAEPLRVPARPPAYNGYASEGYPNAVAAHGQAVYSVAVSSDARLVASGGKDRVAKLWDRQTGRVLVGLGGHGGTVVAVSFPPDGRTLLTADEAGTVRVWDAGTGLPRASWDWQIGRLRSVVFAPDGMTAAAGGDREVLVWDLDGLG